MEESKDTNQLKRLGPEPFAPTYFHGTKADLKVGDLVEVGFNSNYGQRKMRNTFFSQLHRTRLFGALSLHLAKEEKEFI
jgi:Rifampin ADP-ribosyl transferase